MSTTFTRTYYDVNEQEMQNSSVQNTNNWVMNSSLRENLNNCFANDGGRHAQSETARPQNSNGSLNLHEKVHVETLLQNRHVEAASFDRTNKDYANVKLSNPKLCGNSKENMTNADTRLTHPLINYRGMYTAEYKFTPFLHMNPQNVIVENEKFITPQRLGTSTRIDAKKENVSNKDLQEELKFSNIVSGLLPKKLN